MSRIKIESYVRFYHAPAPLLAYKPVQCSGIDKDTHSFRMFGKWVERCIKCNAEHEAITSWRESGYAGPHPFLILIEISDTKAPRPYWSIGDYRKYMEAKHAKRAARGTKAMRSSYSEAREIVSTVDAPAKAKKHEKVMELVAQRRAKKAAQKARQGQIETLISAAKEKIGDALRAHEAVALTKVALEIIRIENKTERELRREAAMMLFK